MNKIETIADLFVNLTADIRAEVAMAQCIQKGLVENEFTIQADGFFCRPHVHDLYNATVADTNNSKKLLQLHLSRPGLYDSLPEGLFFQADDEERPVLKTALEMAEDFRINKKKEKNIRRFFAPFEHEFFLHTLRNETFEYELLSGLKSGWLKEYFVDFWELPEKIPVKAAMVMVMFLPYVHTLAGDLRGTAKVLEKIINEPVSMELRYNYYTQALSPCNVLGDFELGHMLTCGENFSEQFPLVVVSIGALHKTKASQFIAGGSYDVLIQTFYNYFMPSTVTINTIFLLKKEHEQLVLSQGEDAPILGISSVI